MQSLNKMSLYNACQNRDVTLVRQLMQNGHDVNAGEWKPMHAAIVNDSIEVVRLLIEHNADLTHQSGHNYLHLASSKYDILEILLQNMFVDERNDDGKTALMQARAFPNCTRLLLEHGANPNAKDIRGWTALHYCAWAGEVDTALVLIEFGAAVDAQDRLGRTPFHIAAQEDQAPMCRLLEQSGASLNSQQ